MVCACNVKSAEVKEGSRGRCSWPTESLSCLVTGCRWRQRWMYRQAVQADLPVPSHLINAVLTVTAHHDWGQGRE